MPAVDQASRSSAEITEPGDQLPAEVRVASTAAVPRARSIIGDVRCCVGCCLIAACSILGCAGFVIGSGAPRQGPFGWES